MSLAIELRHATALFTGVVEGDLGRTSGAPSDAVLASRESLLELLGLRAILVAEQVHGAEIASVDAVDGYCVGVAVADALITTQPDVAVAVHVADCLPIAVAGAGGVAMVHAGWRGLSAGVIEAAVLELRAGGVSGELEAAIGPGVGGCCYEAGPEVHAALATYRAGRARLIDLRAVAAAQLRAAGVRSVSDIGICTLCAPEGLLFSHRRDGPATGRQGGFAWLR
ncbi:MAG: polyphenol oxidase family protein [Solirubrobacteraceae bacterium]